MTTLIRTGEPFGPDSVHIHMTAATIREMLDLLDRTRRALVALDTTDSDDRPATTDDRSGSHLNATVVPTAPQTQPVDLDAIAEKIMPRPTPTTNDDRPATTDCSGGRRGSPTLPADIPLSQDDPADVGQTLADLQQEIATVGAQLFGQQWPKAATWLVETWTYKHTPFNERNALDQLDADECTAVLSGMVEHAPALQAEWQKHLHNEKVRAEQAAQEAATKSGTQRVLAPGPRPAARKGRNNGVVVRERF